MMETYLPATPPFSFSAVVKSHGWVQLAPFSFNEDRQVLSYVERLSSGRVTELALTEAAHGVTLRTEDGLTASEQAEIARKVSWMLALETDFSEFYAMARSEPALAHVEARSLGRVLRSPSLFEDVLKTMLTVNTLWAGTIRMNLTIHRLYGEPLPADPERQAFPTPARLAGLDEKALRQEARLGFRAPFVLALARSVDSGNIDLEALQTSDLPTPELRQKLIGIKGIGAYAAANLLMILGRPDFIPIDSWAMKMVSTHFLNGAPAGPAEVEAAFARFGRWKGLVYWFWDWK